MNDNAFRHLLDFYALSWPGYRKVRNGVKKRISRHMQQLGCRDMDHYLLALEQNRELARAAELLMTVSISRFFRDRSIWQALEEGVLREILKGNQNIVRVWSAGCACGEEVYSFKILWGELGRFNVMPGLQCWGTDINAVYLEKARLGIYRRSSLKEVPAGWLAEYFKPVSEAMFTVSEELKRGIVWRLHHLVSDEPPPETFDLIFLRNNLLTYYNKEVSRPAFLKIVDRLSCRGFLVIGSHEKVPAEVPLLPSPHHASIFQKISCSPVFESRLHPQKKRRP